MNLYKFYKTLTLKNILKNNINYILKLHLTTQVKYYEIEFVVFNLSKEGYKICPNPNTFLFRDYFHPSEHTCRRSGWKEVSNEASQSEDSSQHGLVSMFGNF
jgi:hypothetical protein